MQISFAIYVVLLSLFRHYISILKEFECKNVVKSKRKQRQKLDFMSFDARTYLY